MKFLFVLFFTTVFCGISADLDKKWWKNTEIYDIVVSAYKDHDGDGFGDFEGIISKLDYIKELGVNTIKLSPIFSWSEGISPPYPIDDFKNTHLSAGSLDDFDNLIAEANARGMRVILDLVINHCSIEHEWFKKSQNKIEPYANYFIWTDNIKDEDLSESQVWNQDETRKQYYYHRFDKSTADLNLKNGAVKKEIKSIMKFWLDRGVSGFNLLHAEAYIEAESAKEKGYPSFLEIENRPESYEFVHEIREFIDKYNEEEEGSERILIVEEKPVPEYPNLQGNHTYPMAHMVWRTVFQKDDDDVYWYFKSANIKGVINNIMEANEVGPTMFILEDSTLTRTPNRFQDRQYLDVWLTTLFTLPGIRHIYYGQEIGLSSWKFSPVQTTAMHWDETINSGFTESELIMYSPNVDYWKVNVKKLKDAEYSTLKSVRDLLHLRKSKVVQYGDLNTYAISEYILAFTRSHGKEKLITILNLSNVLHEVNLKRDIPERISGKVQVVSSSPNSIHRKGDIIGQKSVVELRPVSAVVLRV
ncbi:maltase 1-like [Planococcus citri]|uniref:maltase 1-like n=1 Tax=Planococcus citri TaxID=170843 RepID=UPI0031F79AFC